METIIFIIYCIIYILKNMINLVQWAKHELTKFIMKSCQNESLDILIWISGKHWQIYLHAYNIVYSDKNIFCLFGLLLYLLFRSPRCLLQKYQSVNFAKVNLYQEWVLKIKKSRIMHIHFQLKPFIIHSSHLKCLLNFAKHCSYRNTTPFHTQY